MIGLIILVVAAILLLLLTFWRRRKPATLRPIDAFDRLNREVGLALENGTRLHLSLGRGNLFTSRGGSALAGLAMLRRIAERTAVSDRPPIVTSGDAALTILSQDTSQSGYRAACAEEQFRVTAERMTGLSPFSYAAGIIPVTRDEKICLLGIIFAPTIVTAIAPGFIAMPEKFSLTVLLTRIMFPILLFISLAALAMGALNTKRVFFPSALAPALMNIDHCHSTVIRSENRTAYSRRSRRSCLRWLVAVCFSNPLPIEKRTTTST